MNVTTRTVGRETIVTVEAGNAGGTGIIKAVQVTLDGTGLFSRSEFVGLTINQIKNNFTLIVDGQDVLGKDATILDSDGVVDFQYGYSGTAYFRQLKNV